MRCPQCETEIADDHPEVAGLCICPNGLCARTLVMLEHDTARLANANDTTTLTDGQLSALRAQRKKVRA